MTPAEHLTQQKRLFDYYAEELRFLRNDAAAFADRYPQEAGKLRLRDRAADPHVERLLEGVALLAGRVRARIDDDFPELTDALFGILYQHYLAPVPSLAVAQFVPNPGDADIVTGKRIPRGTELLTDPVDGVRCEYRTGYAATLWPLEVSAATVRPRPFPPGVPELAPDGARSVLILTLRPNGPVALSQTALGANEADAVRFYLAGDPAVSAALYEHLLNDAARVVVRNPDPGAGGVEARADFDPASRDHPWVRPVGFGPDETLLPYPRNALPGYQVLTEFFAYRDKFMFIDLAGWKAARSAGATAGRAVEVLVFFDREVTAGTQAGVGATTFLTGCAPAVNLFERTAEVFVHDHRRAEYEVVPDRHHPDGYEVYSVGEVAHRDPATGRDARFDPFYSFHHQPHEPTRRYWYARRRPSGRTVRRRGEDRPDPGTEVDLCFVDLGFDPGRPAEDRVEVRLTCLNRDLPNEFSESGGGPVRFEARGAGGTVRCVRPPTRTLRPPVRTGAFWRLASHLALNHLSITGPDALRQYLRLYDFSDPEANPDLAAANRQVVDSLLRVDSRADVAFAVVGGNAGYARGVAVEVQLDEAELVETGAFLFASVLDRFLALFASVNSFTRLAVTTKQRGSKPVKVWPARTGTRPLI